MKSGIYCYENQINHKVYIGQAIDLDRRIYEHDYHLVRGTDKATALQRAVSKYGIDSFSVTMLEICPIESLNEKEMYYIKAYNSNDKRYGYNLSLGGNSGMLGYKHSDETKQKISNAKKGWKMSDAHKAFISKLHKGKIVTEETRKKISQAISGEKHWAFGKHPSEETREKLRNKKGLEKSYQFGTKSKNSSSKYFGVHRLKSKGHIYWIADIKVKGCGIHIGSSKEEVEAAKMYDNYIVENGLPHPLNFPVILESIGE